MYKALSKSGFPRQKNLKQKLSVDAFEKCNSRAEKVRKKLKEKDRKRCKVKYYHAGHGLIMNYEAAQPSLQVSSAQCYGISPNRTC